MARLLQGHQELYIVVSLTVNHARVSPVLFLIDRQYMMGGVCKTEATIHGKVVIVTGANVGLGKSTAQDMVSRGNYRILNFF